MNRPPHWDENKTLEFVSFIAGEQSFCIEITQIREIRRWTPVTALPHADKAVCGVINLRGAVIPIVDLTEQLSLGASKPTERHVVIVVTLGDQTGGLLVDAVSEILAIDVESICDAPAISRGTSGDCILGLVSVDDEMSRILALETILPQALDDAA